MDTGKEVLAFSWTLGYTGRRFTHKEEQRIKKMRDRLTECL